MRQPGRSTQLPWERCLPSCLWLLASPGSIVYTEDNNRNNDRASNEESTRDSARQRAGGWCEPVCGSAEAPSRAVTVKRQACADMFRRK
jgi:hypothetical protein